MNPVKTIFFGSASDSVIVLQKLIGLRITDYELRILAVVTQPPRPVGREQRVTPTPVELWAKEKNIAVLSFPSGKEKSWTFENEQTVVDTLEPFQADLLISASYGQKIPTRTIADAAHGGLNVHPSLLPRWRGADPVPWAILSGDHQTGVTIVTLSEQFDKGKIIALKKVPITNLDTSDPLRTRLFELGANLLLDSLPTYLTSKGDALQDLVLQGVAPTPYARRLTRKDGFEPWESLQKAMSDPTEAQRIDRKFRAFTPWPGIWTKIELREKSLEFSKKRLKILSCHLSSVLVIDMVQLEGKKAVPYEQFAKAYLPPPQTP